MDLGLLRQLCETRAAAPPLAPYHLRARDYAAAAMAGTDNRLPAVVIDCGTGYTKMGYAGNSAPNHIRTPAQLSAPCAPAASSPPFSSIRSLALPRGCRCSRAACKHRPFEQPRAHPTSAVFVFTQCRRASAPSRLLAGGCRLAEW